MHEEIKVFKEFEEFKKITNTKSSNNSNNSNFTKIHSTRRILTHQIITIVVNLSYPILIND